MKSTTVFLANANSEIRTVSISTLETNAIIHLGASVNNALHLGLKDLMTYGDILNISDGVLTYKTKVFKYVLRAGVKESEIDSDIDI
jgi:hypothetical protein